MSTVFVLTSPLQVAHALHYRAQTGLVDGDCVLLHVLSVNDNSNRQADDVVSAARWSAVHRLASYPPRTERDATTSPRFHERTARAEFVSQVSSALSGVRIERVVLGDYRPLAFRQVLSLVGPEIEVVLLDDGAGTRGVMRFRENPHGAGVITGEIIRGRPLRAYEGVEDAEDPFTYLDPRRLTFFSIYRGRLAEEDRWIENRYYSDLFSTEAPTILDECWFVGTIHAELRMTSVKQYVRLVDRIAKVVCDRFVYIAHRREDPDKLALLREVTGVEVRDLGVPFETFVAERRQAPEVVLSVGSTVVDTASRMLAGHARVIVVLPPREYFRGPKGSHLRNTICDAVVGNEGVLSVLADEQQLLARLDLARLRPEVSEIDATTWAVASLDELVQGLVASSIDVGRCYREAAGKGLHRLSSSPQTESLRLAASIVPLGREQFRFRVSFGSNDQDIDVSVETATSHVIRHGDGLVALGVATDQDGRFGIRVLGVPPRSGSAQVRLHTLAGPNAKGSIHEGDPMLGFALVARPTRVPAVDLTLPEGTLLQLQVDRCDPLFSVFPLEWDGGRADIVLAELDAEVMNAVAGQLGGRAVLLNCRPATNGRWPLTTPLQIAADRKSLRVRAERGDWVEFGNRSSRLRIANQDGLGGSSRIVGFDQARIDDADRLWMRELSRFTTLETSVKNITGKG